MSSPNEQAQGNTIVPPVNPKPEGGRRRKKMLKIDLVEELEVLKNAGTSNVQTKADT